MKNIRNFDEYLFEAVDAPAEMAEVAEGPGSGQKAKTTPTPAVTKTYTLSDTLNLPAKDILLRNSTGNNNVIFLSPAASPKTLFKYMVDGTYSWFDFDISVRNLTKDKEGNLVGEAQPQNSVVRKAMTSLVPSQNLTQDGWLKLMVPIDKLKTGLAEVKKNGGKSGKIDAGYGVGVQLTLAS
jgi:hypothetical protein